MKSTNALLLLICACVPKPVPTPIVEPPTQPEVAEPPEPKAEIEAPEIVDEPVVVAHRCAALDLEAWTSELEAASPKAVPELLAKLGLQATDPDDYEEDTAWHAAVHLRAVRLHQVELGGPPGIEQIVEVELAGTPALDETHARAVVQVFIQGENGELCRVLDDDELSASLVGTQRPAFPHPDGPRPWGPQTIAFVELLAAGQYVISRRHASGETELEEAIDTISYWALDENGELVEIFGPFETYLRRVNGDSVIPFIEVREEVRVIEGSWPRQLETKGTSAVRRVDETKAERSTSRARWKFVDGSYQRQ